MRIEQLNDGPCKTYLLADEASSSAALIDPLLEGVPAYLELLEKQGLRLTHVFDTHTHADHISGATALSTQTGCEYIMHDAANVSPVSRKVVEGDVISVGSIKVQILFTPGHSKDSMSLMTQGALFTGDALFLDAGGAGRDDLYTGDSHAHGETLQRIKRLDGSLVVYPGHDYRDCAPSTLFEQRMRNPLLSLNSVEDYVEFSKRLIFGPADWMEPIVELNITGTTDANILEDPGVALAREANACEPYEAVAEDRPGIMRISPRTLLEELSGDHAPFILDVRMPYELKGALGAFSEALNIPAHTMSIRTSELLEFKDRHIVVVCRTGRRARSVASRLMDQGFETVSVLDGGIVAYRAEEKGPQTILNDFIYLDHAATTYMDPQVVRAMEPYFQERFGNPSSAYRVGHIAAEALKESRATIASLLGAKPSEIFFTAGGTESINAAIFGVAYGHKPGAHLITTVIEHSAVLKSYKRLEELGYKAEYLSVDDEGFVSPEAVAKAVRPETVFVSIGYANNEIGTVQSIKAIARRLHEINEHRLREGLPRVLLHTDACQAAGYLDVDVRSLGVDLMTINGSKLYGPKQTGFLYVKEGIHLIPIIFGGGQERGLRSGTENVPGVVGLAKALEIAQKAREKENERVRALRNHLMERILLEIPGSRLNGPSGAEDPSKEPSRLPNNVNVSFKDADGEALLLYLDRYGICVSTGSACHAKDSSPSHVLTAIGCPNGYLEGSLRLTLGKTTTKTQVDHAFDILKEGVERLR